MEQNGTCSARSWDSPIVIKAIPQDWNVFDYPSMGKFPEVGLEKTAYIDLETNDKKVPFDSLEELEARVMALEGNA